MRRHLITLVLTTGTLISADATRLGNPTQNKDSILLPPREPRLASRADGLERRAWVSHSETKFTRRDKSYHHTPRKYAGDYGNYEDSDDDDDEHGEHDENGGGDDDHNDGHTKHGYPPTQSSSQYTPTFTTTTSTSTISMAPVTSLPPPTRTSSTTRGIITPQPTPASENNSRDGGDDSHNDPGSNGNDDNGGNNNPTSRAAVIAASTVGALLLILILLLIWYCVAVRPKRRERLKGQGAVLSKDSDLESHVTVDLRNGPHTPPHDTRSSSIDGLSSHAMSTTAVNAVGGGASTPGQAPAHGQQAIVESAVRSLSIPPSPRVAQAEPYVALKLAPVAPSPSMSHASFTNAYAVPYPHPVYSQDYPQSYSPTGSPQGAIPTSHGHPSDAFPTHLSTAPATMELDGRPPPPRYPDAIAASQVPGSSPTSPLPVSPLSVASPHLGLHDLTAADEPQYHPQQYPGPRQPNYGDYEPSSLPEVVSPICQLGQTSASLPEYDEAAEAARSGVSNQNNLVGQHRLPGGEEKQAFSSQQPMPRY